MKVNAILHGAVRSIRRTPARSSLTSLGVIIGVAALITTISIGSGAKENIEKTLSGPSARTLYISAMPRHSPKQAMPAQLSIADRLLPHDYFNIRRSVTEVSSGTLHAYATSIRVRANIAAADVNIEGVDTEWLTSGAVQLLDGSMFGSMEVKRAASVCVINQSLASLLYPDGSAVAREVVISDQAFIVVGIVSNVESPQMTRVQDLRAYVPFTTLLRRIDPAAPTTITVQVRRVEEVGLVSGRIKELLEQRRGNRKSEFHIAYSAESIKAYTEGSLTAARSLAAVAAISLVVGGIGIMNIMLAGVSQRRKEIGVRVAVGTRRRDILSQFLTEAVMLSALGGSLGVGLGCIASWSVGRLYGWPTSITASAFLIAFVCSLAIGAFFGYYPARQAASLVPTDALRTEV